MKKIREAAANWLNGIFHPTPEALRAKVREVLDFTTVTKVPRTPEFMRGVITLRGSVVPLDERGDLRLDEYARLGGAGDVERDNQALAPGNRCHLGAL